MIRDVNGLAIRWDNNRMFTIVSESPCVSLDRDDCEKMIKVMQEFLTQKEDVLFEDLHFGQTFMYGDSEYIKTDQHYFQIPSLKYKFISYNCIRLGDYKVCSLGEKTKVLPHENSPTP